VVLGCTGRFVRETYLVRYLYKELIGLTAVLTFSIMTGSRNSDCPCRSPAGALQNRYQKVVRPIGNSGLVELRAHRNRQGL